jgi:hypothetical protein
MGGIGRTALTVASHASSKHRRITAAELACGVDSCARVRLPNCDRTLPLWVVNDEGFPFREAAFFCFSSIFSRATAIFKLFGICSIFPLRITVESRYLESSGNMQQDTGAIGVGYLREVTCACAELGDLSRDDWLNIPDANDITHKKRKAPEKER